MPDSLPNLAGVATADLVETIGAGSFKASYINWARTMNLLHQHAPGWSVDVVPNSEGSLVHRAPGGGGWLMIRFVHIDGSMTPAKPQAIMDHRNNAISFDKITARDVTDTHRRGACMAAAMEFGLGYELWAKMPLESGYINDEETQIPPTPQRSVMQQESPATREKFLEEALKKGLSTFAAEALLKKIGENYANGIKTLNTKNLEWVEETNKAFEPAKSKETVTKVKTESVNEGKDW
jgi:hypothetical protein